MTAAVIDTSKLARALRDKAKFTPEQAEGAADALAEAIQSDIATRADLAELRESLLRAMVETKFDTIKWLIGLIGFQSLAAAASVLMIIHKG